MKYPESIQNLIESFKKLPGIGEKTAERLALSILKMDDEIVNLFSKSLIDVKTKVKRCNKCNNFSEYDLCEICKDKNRLREILCVVDDPKNIILFEKLGIFKGYYHVINGLISPLDGINPEDIKIDELIERIKKEKVKEVIIAVKPSIEGETTALYISKILKNIAVKVSRIAYGVPVGAEIDYVDSLTLEMALENRKEISTNE